MFKAGDRVRALDNYPKWFKKGDILTVKRFDGTYVRIDSVLEPGLTDGGFYPLSFELAPPEFDPNRRWVKGDKLVAIRTYGYGWYDEGDIVTFERYETISGTEYVYITNAAGKTGGFDVTDFQLHEEGNTNTMNNDNIVRLLSSVAVISSTVFAKQNVTKQTEVMALAAGKQVLFVENFTKLADTKLLAERLLAGEDVSMELEFNNVQLSDDERKAIDAVRPVLERLNALKSQGYQWLDDSEHEAAATNFTPYSNQIRRQGYELSKAQAKRIWDKVVPWYMGGDKPASFSGRFDSYNRSVTFNDDMTLTIGCQSRVSRAEVEAIAKHFNFEANV